ncbi:MAG: aminopeptidase [Bacteroidales bacterium]|nr:MAG: aminopeptidase [Bacteroidales bacterium]
MKRRLAILFILLALMNTKANSQEVKPEGYTFTPVKEIQHTPIRNQSSTSTCWIFSSLGFLEAEILRVGKPEIDLSEMYISKNTYFDKADRYVRMQGTINYAGGGSFWDVIETIKKYGITTEEAFKGLNYGEDRHVHGELDEATKAYLDAIIKNPNRKLSTAWKKGLEGIFNAYLGENPKSFSFNGKDYTPSTFAASLGLNLDDYVFITSFSHHPFYKQFILEVPDNWAQKGAYNLPIDEFGQIFDYAVDNGYTVAWASDISEKGFSYKNGVAVVPDVNVVDMSDSDKAKWTNLTDKEKDAQLYTFDKPCFEKTITQEFRQVGFDNLQTTDDHGMLIVGTAKDQNGKVYFKIKNSWGTAGSKYNGYFYASKAFLLYKTTSIMVNKNSIPKPIAVKLGLK